MPDMRGHGKPHGLFIQCLSSGTPAHAATVFTAGMFGDQVLSSGRTISVNFTNATCKAADVFLVQLSSAGCGPCPGAVSGFLVGAISLPRSM